MRLYPHTGLISRVTIPYTCPIAPLITGPHKQWTTFLAISAIYDATGKEKMTDFSAGPRIAPTVTMVFAVALFSLAALPIFAGFTSKFYLFNRTAAQICFGSRDYPYSQA